MAKADSTSLRRHVQANGLALFSEGSFEGHETGALRDAVNGWIRSGYELYELYGW